ncbi:hypothetical protein C2E20_6537 [Micractinium conductrix]|uniref:Uncharacterized protein n=1 Tax=Micractinium conductrix TaxID=554055 RepID=A0A2P6V7H9_9CHLO|nr:hypothetical protein C2E20_6537 [Micractinium conductrix]|eukprot:PSC70043.1 hypothetical protein C2E20_6537 [Micractinium conductrix]
MAALPVSSPPRHTMSSAEGVPKAMSQDDIVMHGHVVHVHGGLAKNEVHPPQHAPQTFNYAQVAREEIHDVAVHPPPVRLASGKPTGVEQWDKVNSPKSTHHAEDFKELLIPGAHKEQH